MATLLGMMGTGDWATWDSDMRPKSWRSTLFRLEPNGDTPLLGITSMMKSSIVDDPEFYWWTKGIPVHNATVTAVYTNDPTGATPAAYVSDGAVNQILYFTMSTSDAAIFREGHYVLARYSADFKVDVVGLVTTIASTFVAVQILEADNNSSSFDLSDCDILQLIGNVNAEGDPIPDAIAYAPTKIYNLTQIFRDPVDITRTARKTRLRVGRGKSYEEQKRDALLDHGLAMERSLIYGIRTDNTGINGKPMRTTRGIINTIKTYASANVLNFQTDSTYAGNTWVQGGEDWLNNALELIFRYGSREKLVLCGSGALLGLQNLANAGIQFQMLPGKDVAYGLKLNSWVTSFGDLFLKVHPLFSLDTINRYSMIILEPKEIEFRYIDDTFFKPDDGEKKAGSIGIDGTKEEWLTEGGWEFHFPEGWAYLNGVGLDSTL